jgi:hypothetical protein
MSTNAPLFSMPGMAHGVSSKNVKPAEAKTESAEADANPGEVDAEMYLKPFDELSNPQGYTFFEPF